MAVEFRHIAIHQNGVVTAGGKFIYGFAAIFCPVGFDAKTIEHELPELAIEGMIFGGKNAKVGNGRGLDDGFAPDDFRVTGQADGAQGFRSFAGDHIHQRVK